MNRTIIFKNAGLWLLLIGSTLGQISEPDADLSSIKEVLIIHHSHLDVGYTHSQEALWQLQKEYIQNALYLLKQTEDWDEQNAPSWTCEVTAPVIRWLETAMPEEVKRFKKYARQGRMAISALEYNTTPLSSSESLVRQLQDIAYLRELTGTPINTVNIHDVTGVPWTAVDLFLDSGIELVIMGINLGFSGSPTPRPGIYQWQGPGGRDIFVMNGEHYSIFDQVANTQSLNLDTMQTGLNKYLKRLKERDYPYDFVYLSATVAPVHYDNGPPNPELPELVRQWNAQGRTPKLRFVTPPQLLERIKQLPPELIVKVRGDWTDFWNLGSASSAYETSVSRTVGNDLAAIDMMHSYNGHDHDHGHPHPHIPEGREKGIKKAWDALNLYNEHTWGASSSIRRPDSETVRDQWFLKAVPIIEAKSMVQYLLRKELQAIANNPWASRKRYGLLVVNPTGQKQNEPLHVSEQWLKNRMLTESHLVNTTRNRESRPLGGLYGPVEMEPYSWKIIPIDAIKPVRRSAVIKISGNAIETPFYRLRFDPATGRVTELFDIINKRQILDGDSPWGFFELVHEQPDPAVDSSRRSYYVRNVQDEIYGKTGWKPNWVAKQQGYQKGSVKCNAFKLDRAAILEITADVKGVRDLRSQIILHDDTSRIDLVSKYVKELVNSPESLYFTFPLQLNKDWQSHFNTAGVPVRLDTDQIPGTSRDWFTVDSYVSVHDGLYGATLYCPDAPMIQVGGFNFALDRKEIPRQENPLLLAWPMNNYWFTNFKANQPGPVTFRYSFELFSGTFNPVETEIKSRAVSSPLLTHPVFEFTNKTQGQFINVAGEGLAVTYIKQARDGQGVIVRLINLTDEPVTGKVELPEMAVKKAWLSNPLDEKKSPLKVTDNAASHTFAPSQLTTIYLLASPMK